MSRTTQRPAPVAHEPLSYRIPDAARVSGYSRSYLYKLAAEGKLRLSRVGRRTTIPAADLRRLIEDGCSKAA